MKDRHFNLIWLYIVLTTDQGTLFIGNCWNIRLDCAKEKDFYNFPDYMQIYFIIRVYKSKKQVFLFEHNALSLQQTEKKDYSLYILTIINYVVPIHLILFK